jgi:hypothetical protein
MKFMHFKGLRIDVKEISHYCQYDEEYVSIDFKRGGKDITVKAKIEELDAAIAEFNKESK